MITVDLVLIPLMGIGNVACVYLAIIGMITREINMTTMTLLRQYL